jgi:hypothetical protein
MFATAFTPRAAGSHTAVVTFTSRSADRIVVDGGSGEWRLDADRGRRSQFLVCTQNRHNPDTAEAAAAPLAAHGAAFLIGRISDVVRAPTAPDRWVIQICGYTLCDIPNIWAKSGTGRYPLRYTTLEALGIDLDTLPPFRPLPDPVGVAATDAPGVREAPMPWPAPPRRAIPAVPPRITQAPPPRTVPAALARGSDAWDRLDAILGQLDRVPDLAEPLDPLAWDAQGLPQ